MNRYPIPAQKTRTEIMVVNSRFISTIAPAFTIEEAKAFIAEMKAEFSDATHNVPAFVIGYGASVITHSSDDGEPSGTAGRPALAVLSGSGLGDAVVVVTRYFGGTKLGTGGLVRAYSDAVRAVLEVVPRAEKVLTHIITINLAYHWFERARLLISEYNGQIMEEIFLTEVTITARFAVERFPAFNAALSEMTHGSVQAEITRTEEAIVPLDVGL